MRFLLALLGLSYVFCPYDLFPDFFIGLGWIDDVTVLGLLWWYFFGRKRFKYQGYYEKGRQSSAGQSAESSYEEKNTGTGYDDPYSVLGVGRDATSEQIKQAYRQLANQYHPDKVLHLGEEFRELAERRFKKIQEAYQTLIPK
ncbi:MAG: DnaJ domain-containing protein [Deltaproteobacteria bacterium]|nr:DnaJ domain-containing protein [Deltaproteobacteria bacterium]